MKKAVICIALLFLLTFAGPVRAAPREVSDWAELRLAVASASPGDHIVLACDLEADSEIAVGKDLTIAGGGHAVYAKSGYSGRALAVKKVAVTIQDTEFSGFCHTKGNAAAGGAVFADAAALKLEGCAFSDNFADNSGGALYQCKGTLEASGCAFVRNTACTTDGGSGFGGAVFNDGADAAFRDCVFSENRAGRYGGAVYATFNSSSADNDAVLRGCAFEQNEAAEGGGAVYGLTEFKPFTVDACTFTRNRVTGADRGGGAIAAYTREMYVSGSTFTQNASDGEGPALLMYSGVLTLDADSFDRNTRGDSYDFGEDIALAYGYGVRSLALTVEGQPCGGSMDIGDRAELFVGSGSTDAPFVLETDGSALALEDGGWARPVAGGYVMAFTGESSGKAQITLREDREKYQISSEGERGKAYVVMDVNVSTMSAKRLLTGFSFRGIKDAKIKIQDQAVDAEVPAGTDVTRLIPRIECEGASVSPADGVPTDFSSPVTYTVKAQNGKTRDYTVTVRVQTGELAITGIPNNRIVYAGGQYTLRASLPGGKWSYYAFTAAAKVKDGDLVLTPCGAGGGWVEYEVKSGGETQRQRIYFTVVPSVLPLTGQSREGIALFMLGAVLCVAALKALPHTTDA